MRLPMSRLTTEFEQSLDRRRREADDFYRAITPAGISEDAANVMRQALAGMLWSKQYFFLRYRQMARGARRRSDAASCTRRGCATASGSI